VTEGYLRVGTKWCPKHPAKPINWRNWIRKWLRKPYRATQGSQCNCPSVVVQVPRSTYAPAQVPNQVLERFYAQLIADRPTFTVQAGQYGDQRRCIVVTMDPLPREFEGFEVIWKVQGRTGAI